MPIEMRDFSAGWIASDDAYNGRKNGMLQMDNMCLDENGALTLVRGTNNISNVALPSKSHTLFSRYIGSKFFRYSASQDGNIYRDANKAGSWNVTTLTGGSTTRADFAAALNQIFIVSGNQYKKDDGTNTYPIGLPTPVAPTTSVYGTPSQIDLQNLDGVGQFTNWSVDQGVLTYNNMNADMRFQVDPTSFQAVIRTVFASAKDFTNYPATGSYGVGTQTPNDIIQFYLSIPDATQIQSLNIKFLSFDPGSTPSTSAPTGSYYMFQWNSTDNPNPFQSNLWNLLTAHISDFQQFGDTSQSYWNSIKAITITIVAASQDTGYGFTEINQQGGDRAALDGQYEYYTQNVYNTGDYQALSSLSPASIPIRVGQGALNVSITSPSDPQTNAVNIYRREINSQTLPTFLKQIVTPYSTFLDGLSDVNLLADSGITGNFFLQSVQTITDPILAIVGLYFARMLYFTGSQVYISDYLDPDAFDSRYVLKYSGNVAETFMWAKKVSNSIIYIGTNYDIYQLSGTLTALPDGTFDANIRSLGVQYPPVSQAIACDSGSVVYMANDGWRILGVYGDDTNNLSANLDLLFKGYTRYGTLPVIPGYDNTSPARCSLNKGKFYTIVTLSDGSTRIFVYDIKKTYWYSILIQATSLFTEEDGTLIAGHMDSTINQLDFPNTYLVEGVNPQINILTPIFDGGTPRQRKDTFTLKIRLDTGNVPVTLTVYRDGVPQVVSAALNANGSTEFDFDALNFTLGKSYQFAINGAPSFLKLFYIQLEYTDRPVQLTRLRIPPANKGSSGKKRMFTAPPLVIDTLGNNVNFVPELDGVSGAVTNPIINTNEKTTYIPTFAQEVVATDVGGTLSGGLFEFYGLFEQDWTADIIPSGRLVDQIGPTEALRIAFLERFRYRCICEGTSINYTVFIEDVALWSNSFTTIPNVDKTYEIVLPKGLNGTTFRIVLSSGSLIHRYAAKVKLRITGGAADGKWV